MAQVRYVSATRVYAKDVPPAVDVWALAACLYRCLTGFYPRNFAQN